MSLNNYTFDADQRLTDETQTGQNGGNGVDPKQIEFGYNALGQFTSVARYNFVGVGPMVDVATGTFSYDTGNRLTGLDYTYGGGGHAIDAYSWTLDNADRVTSVNSTVDGTASYGYDPTDQLTSASYTGTNAPPNAAYSYTKNGNRTMSGYQNGTGNELASDGTFNYGYDGEGNRTVRTRISNASANDYQTKFFYDYRNRLTDEEYFNNSGTLTKHVHYVYDTLDREIGKQVDDTGSGSYDRSEWYAYDGSQPVEQFDANGNLTMRDFNGPSPAGVDVLMAQEPIVTLGQAGSSDWDLTDNLGTLRYMVSDASAVVDHVIADAFGQTTSESNTSVSHWQGFAGGHADPDTHDVLNGERRYDAGTGGWQTKDPTGFAGGDANTGRYADNSPTNGVDPSGLQVTVVTHGTWHIDEQSYAAWMMAQGLGNAAPEPTTWGVISNYFISEWKTGWAVAQHPIAAAGGFLGSYGHGLVNLGIGTWNIGHDLVTMPIDLVGTAASNSYQPISYYGQASQAAVQQGNLGSFYANSIANMASLGWWGYAQGMRNWAQTGNADQWQQASVAPLWAAVAMRATQARPPAPATRPGPPPPGIPGGTPRPPFGGTVGPPNNPTWSRWPPPASGGSPILGPRPPSGARGPMGPGGPRITPPQSPSNWPFPPSGGPPGYPFPPSPN